MMNASTIVRIWFCLSISVAIVLAGIAPQRRATRGIGHNLFYFIKYPLEHHVESGHPVRLRCGVNVKTNIKYHWILDNQPLEPQSTTGRRYQDGSDLYISNAIRKLDDGVFKCVATNTSSKFSIVSKGYSITVYQMDPNVSVTLVKPNVLQDIRVSSVVELSCKTTAYPPVTDKKISWYHNYQRLKGPTALQKGVVVLPNGNLRIKSYNLKDAGSYRCQIYHPAGDVMSNLPLAIATGDTSPNYVVEINPKLYLRYFRGDEDIKLECPIKILRNSPGFVHWSYRPRLDLSSKMKNFEKHCGRVKEDCISENFELLRNQKPGQSVTGFYSCQIMANGTVSKRYVIEVRQAENPRLNATNFGLRHRSDLVIPVAGKSYTIRVYIDLTPKTRSHMIVADPTPKFQWFTPSGANISTEGRLRIIDGRDLYFDNVLPTDTGYYTFTATNLAGIQKWRLQVVVAFPAIMVSTDNTKIFVRETKRFTKRCDVRKMSAYPVAKIIWMKDGKPIELSSSRIKVDQQSGVLDILRVTPADKGKYWCQVKTMNINEPQVSGAFSLVVRKQLRITVTDPQPFLERGIQGKLTCMASGEQPITFFWYRDISNTLTQLRSKTSRFQIEKDSHTPGKSVLVIHKSRDDDAGLYVCEAVDQRGYRLKTKYEVVVGEKPIIKTSTEKNITVIEGRSFRLDCTGTGDPPPKTSWIRRRLTSGPESLTLDSFTTTDPLHARRFLFDNGTLIIRQARFIDEGIYQCIVGHKHAITSGRDIHVRVVLMNGRSAEDMNRDFRRRSPLTKTIFIVVGCAVAYLGLIFALTVYCSLRMMRKRRKYTETIVVGPGTKADLAGITAAESQCLMSNGGDSVVGGKFSSGQISPSASMFYRPFDATSNVSSSLEPPPAPPYPRERLVKIATLGKGEFGDVLLARAPVIGSNNEICDTEMLVSVITLQGAKERRVIDDYVSQIEMFSKLDHRSIAKMTGLFFEKEPHCFLLEYGLWGDLKQFLHAVRRGHPGQPYESSVTGYLGTPDNPTVQSLSYSQRMHICSQVANGMEHISNLRYVHKDLAARNIILSPNMDVKISNLGLCNSGYSDDYFPLRLVHRSANPSFRSGRMVPLRWMPPEVIINGTFSPETDIWSYAIFVYEVLSLGETPLRKHTHSEIVMAACAHHLVPEMPPGSTPELQTLLMRCWSEQPKERPSFSEISVLIGGMVVECDV